MFGDAVDCAGVRIHRRKWFPFQLPRYTMAPDGHIWFHPRSTAYRDDFSAEPLHWQGFFIHEMTHVWQTQANGRWYLPLRRHPFCRYAYDFEPGRPLAHYGIEQQAEIVRHAFLLMRGAQGPGTATLAEYCAILPFAPFGAPSEIAAPHANA